MARILVIGDLHEPFSLDQYFDFCRAIRKRHKTTHTIFIGDLIDNHYSSFHDTDADGYGGQDELQLAVKRLKRWHKAFPNADVCAGNHDRIIARKLFAAGIPSVWQRDLTDVLEIPTWNVELTVNYDGVKYIHGDKGGTARTKALAQGRSVVQGHRHTESYVWHHPGAKTFGMQVGSGIDEHSYAMAYAAESIPALSCGVVIDGTRPVVEKME